VKHDVGHHEDPKRRAGKGKGHGETGGFERRASERAVEASGAVAAPKREEAKEAEHGEHQAASVGGRQEPHGRETRHRQHRKQQLLARAHGHTECQGLLRWHENVGMHQLPARLFPLFDLLLFRHGLHLWQKFIVFVR